MHTHTMERARYNMAQQQIRPWKVSDDHVLDIVQELPRERFVPHSYRPFAFTDMRIPLGHGQYMMEPRLEARMLQSLMIKPSDKILEIGTGSGFVTACLARLGNKVVSYEIHEDLHNSAADHLSRQGINNVQLHLGNGLEATARGEKFDVVAITGSMPVYENTLEKLLNPDARLFVVVGQSPVMNALLIRNCNGEFVEDYLFETDLAALEHISEPEHFSL